MSIDEIWKQFGDDIAKIAIEFEPGENTWCVKFKTPLGGTHVERDADMAKAAEKTLNWYKNCRYISGVNTGWEWRGEQE